MTDEEMVKGSRANYGIPVKVLAGKALKRLKDKEELERKEKVMKESDLRAGEDIQLTLSVIFPQSMWDMMRCVWIMKAVF